MIVILNQVRRGLNQLLHRYYEVLYPRRTSIDHKNIKAHSFYVWYVAFRELAVARYFAAIGA
jgi:hypothetical protein